MKDIKKIIPSVLRELELPEKQKKTKLLLEWESIAGEKISKYTTPRLSSNGVIFVYVKEPVVAYEISQRHRLSILKRAQAVFGEEKIKDVRVRVGTIE